MCLAQRKYPETWALAPIPRESYFLLFCFCLFGGKNQVTLHIDCIRLNSRGCWEEVCGESQQGVSQEAESFTLETNGQGGYGHSLKSLQNTSQPGEPGNSSAVPGLIWNAAIFRLFRHL